jgi:hypothetical protein
MTAKYDTSGKALGAEQMPASANPGPKAGFGLSNDYMLVDLMSQYSSAPNKETAEHAFEALAREVATVAKTDPNSLFTRPYSRTLLIHALSLPFSDKSQNPADESALETPPAANIPLAERQARATKIVSLLLDTMKQESVTKTQAYAQRYSLMILAHDDRALTALMKAVRSADTKLYDRIAGEIFNQRTSGMIDKYAMAQQFIDPTAKNESLIHSALYAGNVEIYDRISSMLKVLRDGKAIKDELYNNQFVMPTPNNQLPLFTAANSGDGELFNHFMRDFDALPQELRKQKLQESTLNSWNVTGNAMQPKTRRTSPATLIRVRESVNSAFGREEAQKICDTLCTQINDLGYNAVNHLNAPAGSWKRDLLNDAPRPPKTDAPAKPRRQWVSKPLNHVSDALPPGIQYTIKR